MICTVGRANEKGTQQASNLVPNLIKQGIKKQWLNNDFSVTKKTNHTLHIFNFFEIDIGIGFGHQNTCKVDPQWLQKLTLSDQQPSKDWVPRIRERRKPFCRFPDIILGELISNLFRRICGSILCQSCQLWVLLNMFCMSSNYWWIDC